MTGKDLIIYILKHNLENEVILKNGVLVGFIDEDQLAVKFGVGVWTIRAWSDLGSLDGIRIGEKLYFVDDVHDPRKAEKIN